MKISLVISYAVQIYSSMIGILLMPFYMHLMGAEAFGLVGFFLMLQSWMQLFDLGLSPTLSREMSLYHAGMINFLEAWQRIRSFEWLLGVLSIFTIFMLVLMRNWIATEWLTIKDLSLHQVTLSIIAMALAAAVRWLTGLYRAGLVGMELQVWVNGMGAVFVTLKFVGILPVLLYYSTKPAIFFIYQASIGGVELILFARKIYSVIPGVSDAFFPNLKTLRSILPLASSMAFMSGIWILVTQMDKMVLSRFLTLEDYGYFTLAVSLAGGMLSLLTPLNQVLQPRLTILASQNRKRELQYLYSQTTQSVTALFFSVGGTLAFCAQIFLLAWTGDAKVAELATPILFWYGLANAMVGILIPPFMLQFAYGHLRLHLIGNLILAISLLPAIIFSAYFRGGAGCGIVLLIARLLFFLFWIPLVHRKLLPERIWFWPFNDVVKVALPILCVLAIANQIFPTVDNRFVSIFMIILILIICFLIGMFSGNYSRKIFSNK